MVHNGSIDKLITIVKQKSILAAERENGEMKG